MPGVIAFLGWLGFALARWQIWAKGHLSLFIMAGHVYTHRSQLPRGLLLVPSDGYDGQFYYRLALDPANWSKTAFGITMDQSYRYTRIGYPVLAWLLSLGQHQLVPVVLVAINLLAVAAMAALGGMFARRAEVQAALLRRLAALGDSWMPFPEPLAGHPYRAMRIVAGELGGSDPFRLLADGVPGAKEAMGSQTLVVVGAEFAGRPGFVILNDQVDAATGDRASGEDLQDHACRP